MKTKVLLVLDRILLLGIGFGFVLGFVLFLWSYSSLPPLELFLPPLDLSGPETTDEVLAEKLKGLTNLGELYLRYTKITDAGLVHLKGLTNLGELWLTNTKVTDAGIQELKKALPDCKIWH